MDFTSFINSRDIRDYHREIGYQYNAIEAAWLVSQCHRKTLEQKHEAWKWIIANMPDREIKNYGRWESAEGETIHKVLADYMEMENQFIAEFKDNSGGWLYSYKSYYNTSDRKYDSYSYEGVFTGWDKCVEYVAENEDGEEVSFVEIRRGKPDVDDMFRYNGDIEIDLFGRILNVYPCYSKEENERWYYLDSFFDELWFEFPVPFKKGDIVCLKSRYCPEQFDPIVLTGIIIPPWRERDKYLERRRDSGDTSDMDIWGYAADMEWHNGYHGVYSEVWWNYMDVEYYRKELSGVERVLKPISNWLKGEFGDDLCLLLSAYHQIMSDVAVSKMIPAGKTKEGLKLAGLPVEEE